jgi:peptide/nickel transport system substrate-binding protein
VDTTPTAVGELGTVHWNLILEPATLDPQQANNYGENDVLANLCESLQTLNPDFSVSDGLASMKVEDGGKRLVYTIDPEARFWDGSPVTEEDVAFSLTRVWHTEGVGTPYYTPYFSAVKGIEATGDDEVTVTLNHPDVLFQKMMATAAGVVMQADYTRDHPDMGKPTVPPMCTGPYTFGSWTTGSQLTIKRNDNYWRGTPAMSREIVFTFLQGDASQTQALTGGAIQGMHQPPFTALGQLREHGSLFYGNSLLSFYLVPTRNAPPS